MDASTRPVGEREGPVGGNTGARGRGMRFNDVMDSTYWCQFFRERAARPLPHPPAPALPPASARTLARSLARFQKGEAGEGRIATEVRRFADPAYAEAIGLFVKEEGRHARILADIVRALGGELLKEHWSDRVFVRARRVMGFDTKIAVLLAAERIGLVYYSVLSAMIDGPLGDTLREIAADEREHLRFHEARLADKPLHRLVSWAATIIGGALVVIDHRASLRRL